MKGCGCGDVQPQCQSGRHIQLQPYFIALFPTLPFVRKVGDGSLAEQAKWQHCSIILSISVHTANPTQPYIESDLDFLPSGDFLCDILQSIHFKLQRRNLWSINTHADPALMG